MAVEPEPAPSPPQPDPEIAGIAVVDGEPMAWLRMPGAPLRLVRTGEEVFGWRVVDISATTVELDREGRSLLLAVFEPLGED